MGGRNGWAQGAPVLSTVEPSSRADWSPAWDSPRTARPSEEPER